MTIAVLLSACAAPVPRPMPLAASGPVAVERDGVAYAVDLRPVSSGAELSVSRYGEAFGYDEGLLAERVAEDFCAARGGGLNPAALGWFQSGLWVFDGGCA